MQDNVDERLSVVFLDTKPLTDELKLLGRNSVWGHRIHFLHSSVLVRRIKVNVLAQHHG